MSARLRFKVADRKGQEGAHVPVGKEQSRTYFGRLDGWVCGPDRWMGTLNASAEGNNTTKLQRSREILAKIDISGIPDVRSPCDGQSGKLLYSMSAYHLRLFCFAI